MINQPHTNYSGRTCGSVINITDLRCASEEPSTKDDVEGCNVRTAGIAHDLMNVLCGVLAEAELMEVNLPDGSESCLGLQRIKAGAMLGIEMVRELMLQHQERLVYAVNLSGLVAETLELLKVSLSERIVLKTDLPADLSLISGNAPQIRELVMNLVVNASEAIGQKAGEISVTTAAVKVDADLASDDGSSVSPGEYVLLEIADTGCGVAEQFRAEIFDPFFTTKSAGRGLGLAVVQAIVRDHRGAIKLLSEPEKGAKFQVLFPRLPLIFAAKARNKKAR